MSLTKTIKPSTTVETKLLHECRVCDESFGLESQLTEHLYGHIESSTQLEAIEAKNIISVKLFDCTWCQMQFESAEGLSQHLILHDDRRPHVCGDCGRRLATIEKLEKHRLVHTEKVRRRGRKPVEDRVLECTQCGKEFGGKRQLVQHLRTHSNHRPFHCPQV